MIITCQLRNCFNGIAIETECFDGFSVINSIWKDSRNGAIRSSSHRTQGVPYSGPHRTWIPSSSLPEHRNYPPAAHTHRTQGVPYSSHTEHRGYPTAAPTERREYCTAASQNTERKRRRRRRTRREGIEAMRGRRGRVLRVGGRA